MAAPESLSAIRAHQEAVLQIIDSIVCRLLKEQDGSPPCEGPKQLLHMALVEAEARDAAEQRIHAKAEAELKAKAEAKKVEARRREREEKRVADERAKREREERKQQATTTSLTLQRLTRSRGRVPSSALLAADGADYGEESGSCRGDSAAVPRKIAFFSLSLRDAASRALELDQGKPEADQAHMDHATSDHRGPSMTLGTSASAFASSLTLAVPAAAHVEEDAEPISNLIAQCKLLDASKTISLGAIHERYLKGDLDKTSLRTELRLLIGRERVQEALKALASRAGMPMRRSGVQGRNAASGDDRAEGTQDDLM